MDYERKYNDALERAKKRYDPNPTNGYVGYTNQILQEIFPELKESEDERIKKSIREAITYYWSDDTQALRDILSWLEKQKDTTSAVSINEAYESGFNNGINTVVQEPEEYGLQKEQKPVECIEFDNEFKNQVSHILASVLNKEHNYDKGFVEYAAQSLLGYAKKELKPAEWSEEDIDNLERVDNYLWMLDNYIGDDCAMPQGKSDKIRGNIWEVLSPWLKSLPERFNLQSKYEWSEEDERMLGKCIDAASGYYNPEDKQALKDWLKSLSPQPKENTLPVVRTKEIDEQMFNNIIARFDGEHFKYEMLQAMRTWLIELRERLRWKPSEEQMKALERCVDYLEKSDNEDVYLMKSLYNDLKKL